MPECNEKCEVFSRVVGYFRPVKNWNNGKAEEFKQRKTFSQDKALKNEFRHPRAEAVKPRVACSTE